MKRQHRYQEPERFSREASNVGYVQSCSPDPGRLALLLQHKPGRRHDSTEAALFDPATTGRYQILAHEAMGCEKRTTVAIRLLPLVPSLPVATMSKLKTSANAAGARNLNGLWFAEDMTETYRQNRILGYARVSTTGQTLAAQLDELRAAGCAKVYREQASGARAERRELQRLLRTVQPGDLVTVTRIDRLARSTFDLFAIVKAITDAGAQFRSLAEPWADSTTSTGRLMLAVLGGLADVERDMIRTRTAEGRSRAKGRGQHMGRPPVLTPQQAAEARQRREDGATLAELARSYNVSKATISRLRT